VAARLPARPSGTREGFEAVYGKGNAPGNEFADAEWVPVARGPSCTAAGRRRHRRRSTV